MPPARSAFRDRAPNTTGAENTVVSIASEHEVVSISPMWRIGQGREGAGPSPTARGAPSLAVGREGGRFGLAGEAYRAGAGGRKALPYGTRGSVVGSRS